MSLLDARAMAYLFGGNQLVVIKVEFGEHHPASSNSQNFNQIK
jgi:hypothetical protein